MLAALAVEIDVQLILHVLGNVAGNGELLRIGHVRHEGVDKVDVRENVLGFHDGCRVIAVMDGGGVLRRNVSEGDGGYALVRKGGGVAGINVLPDLQGEALQEGKVLDEMYQLILTGAAGAEASHDAADHVQVDVENEFLQLVLVSRHICLGAQQAAFLGAAPDEAQGVAMRLGGEPLGDTQQADAAGHVVIGTQREGGGVIVSGENDGVLDLAGKVEHNVARGAGVFVLLKNDLSGAHAAADEINGLLGVDVHSGYFVALADVGAQLLLVYVLVSVVGVAVIGDETYGAVFDDVLILPVIHGGIDHDDLTLAASKGEPVVAGHIVEGSLHLCAAGAEIAFAGDLPAVGQKNGLLHGAHLYLKVLKMSLETHLGALSLDILGALELLRGAAGAGVCVVVQYLVYSFGVHSMTSQYVSIKTLYHVFGKMV